MSPQGWRDWFRAAQVRGTTLPPMHTFSDSTDAMRAAVYGLGAVLARKHGAQPYLQRYELVRLPGPTLKARYVYYTPATASPALQRRCSSTGSSAKPWTNARRCLLCLQNW
nr:hypothetical protein [Xanthomonas bromi]